MLCMGRRMQRCHVQEIAKDIFQEQSPKQLYAVRGKLYELLVNCLPPELILRKLALALMRTLDDEVRHKCIDLAAAYEHRLQASPSGASSHGQLPAQSVPSRSGHLFCAASYVKEGYVLTVQCHLLHSEAARNYGLNLFSECQGNYVDQCLVAAGGPKGHLPPRGLRGKDDERVQDLEHCCAGLRCTTGAWPQLHSLHAFSQER